MRNVYTKYMEIEFDPKKDACNLVKHGIRLARASEFKPTKVLQDTRDDYGETRYRGFGHIGSKAFALAFTVPRDTPWQSGSRHQTPTCHREGDQAIWPLEKISR
jgi:uncharacterized protein